MKNKSSFTLIELLVVIGILAILTAAVVLVLNPSELLKQGRDSTRMTDLASLSKTIQLLLTQNPSLSLGTASTVYVSLPDTSTTCANLSLPTLPSGYIYNCVSASSSTLLTGSGWLPIDFTSAIQSISKLPIDPQNTSSTSLYYTYIANPTTQTYELTAILESTKYRLGGSADKVSSDGGNTSYLYEQGSNRTLNPINDSGLVGYWRFDEGSGTSALDSSGNNNTGTLTNGPTWQSASNCKVGSCLSFDGANDYVDVGNVLNMSTSSFSLSVWFKSTALLTQSLIFKEINSGLPNRVGYSLYTRASNPYISFVIGDGTNLINPTCPNVFNDGNYHQLVVTKDSSNASIYMDGLSCNSAGSSLIGNISNSTNLKFGGGIGYLNGFLDDVRIYNKNLSAAEILSLYNATR